MRGLLAIVFFLAAAPLLAENAHVITPGPPVFIGQLRIQSPHPDPWMTIAAATDGVESLAVWSSHGSIYAKLLDRDARPLAALPALIVKTQVHDLASIRVVHAGGLYTIFYVDRARRLVAVRVTRGLEIVATAYFADFYPVFDATLAGDEIFVSGIGRVLRLGPDLALRDDLRFGDFGARRVGVSPRGPVLLAMESGAVTARNLQSNAEARIASFDGQAYSPNLVWTGSEFTAAWLECHDFATCVVRTVRIDAELRSIASADIEAAYCHFCFEGVSVVPLGDDVVLMLWPGEGTKAAQRFRKGQPVDAEPIAVGRTTAIATPHGPLLITSGLDAGIAGPDLEVAWREIAHVAAAQRLIAAGGSSRELAVIWDDNFGDAVASVLEVDGTPLREIPVQVGSGVIVAGSALIASDGRDLYALTTGSRTHFQKLTAGSEPVEVNVHPHAFVWVPGIGFLTVRDRSLAVISRFGKLRDACPGAPVLAWDAPGPLVHGGGETLMAGNGVLTRIRGGCAGEEELEPAVPWSPALAWRDGQWASLFTKDNRLHVAVAAEGGAFAPSPRPLFDTYAPHHDAAIATAGEYWVVVAVTEDALAVALLDAGGSLLYRTIIAGDVVATRPYLVPVSDTEVLAVYQQRDFAPLWLGRWRIVVQRLTITGGTTRRRTVRH